MATVTLVYPYFHPQNDTSIFRFPPLGLGYIAAYLRSHGISVEIVDCTFLAQSAAVEKIRKSNPKIIGIQSMFSMKNKSLELAKEFRNSCELLVAGGPLATTNPELFLEDFDLVVIGEGEQTMLEIVLEAQERGNFSRINGIIYKDKETKQIERTPDRRLIEDLDSLPFPSRDLFPNQAYKKFYSKFGYATTAIMTSRGCPFSCDFCSKPIFGDQFKWRTASNVVDEIEEVLGLGYDRLWFADDCFTLNPKRLMSICDEIVKRGLKIDWECLSRVDTLDSEAVKKMKRAGCVRMFFGIESGNDCILALMKKQITINQARKALSLCEANDVKAGAFFIVGYPGENEETVLNTIEFASSLPLDYLSFTMPYPIPGTPLYERLNGDMISSEWEEPKNLNIVKHKLLFNSELSETKLKFAIIKGMIQFYIRKYTGKQGYKLFGAPFEKLTSAIYRLL